MLYTGYTYDEPAAYSAAKHYARQLVAAVGILEATRLVQRAIDPGMTWLEVAKAVGHVLDDATTCTCTPISWEDCPVCKRAHEQIHSEGLPY